MALLNFPASASAGDTYIQNSVTYEYNAAGYWETQSTSGGSHTPGGAVYAGGADYTYSDLVGGTGTATFRGFKDDSSKLVVPSLQTAGVLLTNGVGTGINTVNNSGNWETVTFASTVFHYMPTPNTAAFTIQDFKHVHNLNVYYDWDIQGGVGTGPDKVSYSFDNCETIDGFSAEVVNAVRAPTSSGLTPVGLIITFVNSPNLRHVRGLRYLPSEGKYDAGLYFTGCKLDQASVDDILAEAAARPSNKLKVLSLEGGTNAAPSAAGLANVAILIGQGTTVTHN